MYEHRYVTYFLLQACKNIKLVLFTVYLWIDFPTMFLEDIMVLLFLIIAPSGWGNGYFVVTLYDTTPSPSPTRALKRKV